MRSTLYRYKFDGSVPMPEIEASLHLAILAAEGLFGESKVRMDCAYSIDEKRRVCVVDGSNEVGRCICQIFTGYLTKEFDPDSFRVRRVKPRATETPPSGAALPQKTAAQAVA